MATVVAPGAGELVTVWAWDCDFDRLQVERVHIKRTFSAGSGSLTAGNWDIESMLFNDNVNSGSKSLITSTGSASASVSQFGLTRRVYIVCMRTHRDGHVIPHPPLSG